jgi:hypothetical protein
MKLIKGLPEDGPEQDLTANGFENKGLTPRIDVRRKLVITIGE